MGEIIEQDQIGIIIAPNPFSNSTTFHFEKPIQNGQLILFDILGKQVRNQSFTGEKAIIDRNNLSSGIYLVKVFENGENLGTKKIIVSD